jgi:hypothetical protein
MPETLADIADLLLKYSASLHKQAIQAVNEGRNDSSFDLKRVSDDCFSGARTLFRLFKDSE